MTPGEATQAQANREDGWPYPDNDSDLKEDQRAETKEPECPHFVDRIREDCWECWEEDRPGPPDPDLFRYGLSD